jgi:hypothetical protein
LARLRHRLFTARRPPTSFAARDTGRTGFEVIAGRIDERSFPKTLNDGVFPVVRIGSLWRQSRKAPIRFDVEHFVFFSSA